MTDPITRAGFVALIGEPNAGKSTLLNRMVGAKVSIVTHKVQTTRARIRGIAVAALLLSLRFSAGAGFLALLSGHRSSRLACRCRSAQQVIVNARNLAAKYFGGLISKVCQLLHGVAGALILHGLGDCDRFRPELLAFLLIEDDGADMGQWH